MKRVRGFTLIELLVVIAIIAILAAILFPVFARAREKARQNNCLSNLKQVVLSALMYADDYDETSVPNWGSNGWMYLLQPYTMNSQIHFCLTGGGYWRTDYGINGHISPASGQKLTEIKYPSQTIYFADSDWTQSTADYGFSNSYKLTPYLGHPIYFHYSYFIPARHNGGANIAYVDGHVKWRHMKICPNDPGTGPVKKTRVPQDIYWHPTLGPGYFHGVRAE